jgi:DNA-binding NarL/FixJ family response regulator
MQFAPEYAILCPGVTVSAHDSLTAKPMSKLGILIADDAEEVRRDLRTILQLAPDLLVLGEAINGIEAVAMAESLRPDIVLMDLRMPGIDGLEAAEQIKKRDLAKGVIMLTIYGQQENRTRAANVGVDLFIEKDTEIDVLIASVREVGQSCMQRADGLGVDR